VSPRAFGGSAKPNPFKEEAKEQKNSDLLAMGSDDDDEFPDDIFSDAGI
jgi:hypothetical protein